MLDPRLDLPDLEADDIPEGLQEPAYSYLPPVSNENGAPNFDVYWEMKRIG